MISTLYEKAVVTILADWLKGLMTETECLNRLIECTPKEDLNKAING